MAKKYDKEALLRDWRAGTYRTKDLLAHAYKISPTRVKQLTKGIGQDLVPIVTEKFELEQKVRLLTDEEVTVIDKNVTFKLRLLDDVQRFGHKAMIKASALLDAEETGQGFKAIVEGVDKLTVTHGLNPRFANGTHIEINNANSAKAGAAAAVIPDNPIEAARVYGEIMGGASL